MTDVQAVYKVQKYDIKQSIERTNQNIMPKSMEVNNKIKNYENLSKSSITVSDYNNSQNINTSEDQKFMADSIVSNEPFSHKESFA